MRLSIIVSVYNDNHDGFLTSCLDSLLDQDIPVGEYEIIAVDDVSTDDSLAVLREYEKNNPGRVRVIARETNGGPGAGKNTGLRAASGEYVGYIDHDDIVMKDAYKKLLEVAEKEEADLAGGLWQIMDVNGSLVKVSEQKVFKESCEITSEIRKKLLVNGERFWNKIIRKRVIQQSGIWLSEGTYIDDTPTTPFWMGLCNKYAHVDEVVYSTRAHIKSTSRADLTYEKCMQHLATQHRMVENSKISGLYDELKEAIEYRYFYRGFIQNAELCRRGLTEDEVKAYYLELRKDLLEYVPRYAHNPYIKKYISKKQILLAAVFLKMPPAYDRLLKSRGR